MNGFIHSIEDVQEATGLSRHYIDRCYEIMPFLERYRQKAPDQNKYLYSSDIYSVFHQIASLKNQGHDRRAIKTALEESGLGSHEDSEGSRREEEGSARASREVGSSENALTKTLMEELLAAKDEVVRAVKEASAQAVTEKNQTIEALRGQLLLLTDGRHPEEVAAERKAAQERREELEALKRAQEERQAAASARRERRQALLTELAQTTGFLQKNRRQQLIKELERMEGPAE